MEITKLSMLHNLAVKASVACTAATLGGAAYAAEWYGTSLDDEGRAQWNNAANWESTTGVPVGNINFTESVINGKSGSKTVYLDGAYTFSGDYHLYAGTEKAPLVFKSSGENGFAATVNKQMYIGSGAANPAYVVLDGGTYTFMNDINVGWNQSSATLVIKKGARVQLPNWGKLGAGSGGTGTAKLVVDGGEYVGGWRNNAESNNARFNVAEGAGSTAELVVKSGRFRCSNNSNSGNINEALCIGLGDNANGTVTLNDGRIEVSGSTYLGWNASSTGNLVVNGGEMYVSEPIYVGYKGKGTVTLNNGTINIYKSPLRFSRTDVANAVESSVTINGGELRCKRVETQETTSGTAYLTFDGGRLSAVESVDNYMLADDKLIVRVGAKGGTIDTGSYKVGGLNHEIVSALEEGNEDGGLTFTGKGIAIQQGALKYSGTTFVQSGVLAITNGFAITGPVKIGRNGAIAVDITPARTAATDAGEDLAVDGKIALFSASALSFEEATDDLSTSVFLTGPVVGYTLSSEVVDGRTVVYATITNVDNIATTRKVTSYIATDNYVDQDGAWSNGQPANNSYDVGIFTADGIMHIWGDGKGAINNRKFGDFVVRGCTAKVRYGGNGYPDIGVKHVAGNGTLELAQAGLVGNGTLNIVSDKNVKVVITTEGASGTARDAWIGVNNADATAATIVNGDVVTSNGFVAIWRNVTLNGNLVISPWSVNSYVGGTAGDTLKINGDLVILDGARFDFQSHNVTFGENARLVLMGGTVINTNNLSAWPKTVIAGGIYTYGAVPGASEYTIEGGRLNVVPPADGESFELAGVTVADGVNAADVVKITGTQYNWTVAYDSASGKVTATAGEPYDASTPNYWVGGAQGYWNVAANWSRGIPSVAQTVIFDGDALVYLDASKTVSNIVADAHVTFRTTNTGSVHPQVHFNEINGTGTLALYHAGLVANGLPGTIAAETTVEIQYINDNTDSWLEGRRGNGSPLMLYGKLTGSGYVIFRDDCHFYGDNSGFEGLVGMEWSDADAAYNKVFMTSESGFSGARRMNVKGKIGIGFKSGEISFGALKLYGFGTHHAINVVDGADVTINVGVGDYDVSLDNSIRFYSCTKFDMTGDFYEGATNATLRKVGEGKISSGLFGSGNLDIAEGTCELTHADSNLNVFIREGAELYASSNVQVGGIAFETGSKFMLPTLESTPVISAVSATFSGVVVILAEGLADTLLDQTDPNSYEMLNATGEFSGTPDTKVVAPCTEQGFGWYARASGGTLKLMRRNPINGFFISIR